MPIIIILKIWRKKKEGSGFFSRNIWGRYFKTFPRNYVVISQPCGGDLKKKVFFLCFNIFVCGVECVRARAGMGR